MDLSLVWLLAGFLLVIVELLSGTFYLLVLGVAAFAGGVVAWLGAEIWWQAIAAAIVAVCGSVWVGALRKRQTAAPMRPLDAGQPATFDSWVNRAAGQARVKYRDALWDATVVGAADCERGEILYVSSVDGNTLEVSKSRPA